MTGGSKGIGLATVQALRAHGFERVLVLSRSAPPADAGGEFISADLSTLAGADAAVEAVRAAGVTRLDLIVLNAGVGLPSFAKQTTADGLPFMLALNHIVQARLLHNLLPLQQSSELKRVVFVSSQAGERATREELLGPLDRFGAISATSAYDFTKALQTMYARGLAKKGIDAVSLHPGAIASSIFESSSHDDPRESAAFLYGVSGVAADIFAPVAQTALALLLKVQQFAWEDMSVGGQRVLWTALDRSVKPGDYVHTFGRLNEHTTPALNDDDVAEHVLQETRKVGKFD